MREKPRTDPVFGATAGGILAMSDLLGNEQYYFLVYNNSENNTIVNEAFSLMHKGDSIALLLPADSFLDSHW